MDELTLTDRQKQIGRLVLKEIRSRLGFLVDVGLDYLSLARATATLSGGEAQRIRLATQIEMCIRDRYYTYGIDFGKMPGF